MLFLAQQAAPGSFLSALFVPFIIFAIFYLLIILPMRRKQRKLEEVISGLKSGDRIVTTGGIYGTIDKVKDSTVLLKVSDQVRIEVAKSAVAGLQPPESK